jgi:putative spermidine/putrescine transport system ATP-binding protein
MTMTRRAAMAAASLASRDAGDRPALVLRGLTRHFGDVVAVDAIDLEVAPGEFLTLLGPSGSGKTTTLRMIAGFTAQTRGTIEIGGSDMTRVPPHRRDVGMVFQNYALFPHMTAAQNIAFPLEMRGVAQAEIKRRVAEALALVKLDDAGRRYPRQLSGGQQQRIALARAVVFGPRLLLMDEPLGALDKKLREALQLEILHISRHLGATVVYVTHDQEEALVMSDRIAIFNGGRIEQLGTGEDLYERPASLFVADFVGESNLFRGSFERDGGGGWLVHPAGRLRVGEAAVARSAIDGAGAAALVIRPERIRLLEPGEAEQAGWNVVEAVVDDALYLGPLRKYEVTLPGGQSAVVRRQAGAGGRDWAEGEQVRLAWGLDDAVLLPEHSGAARGRGTADTAALER